MYIYIYSVCVCLCIYIYTYIYIYIERERDMGPLLRRGVLFRGRRYSAAPGPCRLRVSCRKLAVCSSSVVVCYIHVYVYVYIYIYIYVYWLLSFCPGERGASSSRKLAVFKPKMPRQLGLGNDCGSRLCVWHASRVGRQDCQVV